MSKHIWILFNLTKGYYPVSSYPAYHTIYDTFDYIKKTIDPDFRYHLAGARVCCSLTLLQADDPVLRMSVPEYAKTLKLYFDQLAAQYETNLNARNIKLGKNNTTFYCCDLTGLLLQK